MRLFEKTKAHNFSATENKFKMSLGNLITTVNSHVDFCAI